METISGEQRILEFAAQYFKGETVSGPLTAIGNGEELKLKMCIRDRDDALVNGKTR